MGDFGAILLSCSRREDIAAANAVKCQMPLEPRKRFAKIFSNYLARFGLEGVYERLNNRTVSQIFAAYHDGDLKPIASGQVDAAQFHLYDTPSSPEDPC